MARNGVTGLKALWLCSRKFSSSNVYHKVDQEGRFLYKLMSNNLDRKILTARNTPSGSKPLESKRASMLSKLLMKNISEVLCFGGFEGLDGKGLEITQVSVKNMQTVHVYWTANENEDTDSLDSLLNSISGQVAQQLLHTSAIKQAPQIIFVRDSAFLRLAETTKRLSIVSSELERIDGMSKIHDASVVDQQEELEPIPPLMRMDTFGLPYDKILHRIIMTKRCAHPLHIPTPPTTEEFQAAQEENLSLSSGLSGKNRQQRASLKKFIREYQKSTLRSGQHRTFLNKEQDYSPHLEGNDDYFEDNDYYLEDTNNSMNLNSRRENDN